MLFDACLQRQQVGGVPEEYGDEKDFVNPSVA
jgi:hypothetical protein